MDRTENDFSIVLSTLGEPDEDITEFMGHPGLAKWVVQESPRGERKLTFQEDDGGGLYLTVEGRETEVHFTGRLLDGSVFASSRGNGGPLKFIPTQEDVVEGFALAVSSMQEGEKAIFTIPPKFALTKSGCPASIPWNIPPNQTLWFDIELISFTTDILGDQGILKQTTKIGEGDQHPCDSDEVFVIYDACLKDGTLVSKSEGVEFSLTEGFLCPAFAHALKTMTEGDEAFLVVKPEYGFGDRGRPSMGNETAVPPDATLHVNLRLMSWKSRIGENREIIKTTFRRPKFQGCNSAGMGDFAKVRLIGKLQDGTVFDRRGHNGQEPVVFYPDICCDKDSINWFMKIYKDAIISNQRGRNGQDLVVFSRNKENFVPGLKEAIMTMEEGEIASVIIPPHHAFGTVGSNQFQLAVVPPNSVVIYEIELLSVGGVFEPQSLSKRKLKHNRERPGTWMGVPPAARPQVNPSQQPVPAAPAAVGAQSPATPATPAAGGSGATTPSKNQSSDTDWKGLASCFGFSSSHVP